MSIKKQKSHITLEASYKTKVATLVSWLKRCGLKEEAEQISKIAMPRDEGPLFEVYNHGSEYEEDFYPDLDQDTIKQEEKYNNLYHGRNVIWIGSSGKMVRADAHYVYPIQGNVFYDEKISQLTDKINNSPEKIILYAPYGEMSKVDVQSIKESIEYQEDYGHAALTTGDEELDKYLANKEEYIDDNVDYNWGADDSEIEAAKIPLREEMEGQLKEAESSGDGDFGEFIFQIRDGNHRAFAAINAGERYIWLMISNNQVESIKENAPWVAGYGDILE